MCGHLGVVVTLSPGGGGCMCLGHVCCAASLCTEGRAGPGLHRSGHVHGTSPLPPEPPCLPVPAWPGVQALVRPSVSHVDVSTRLSPGFLWRISAWTRPCLSKCPAGAGLRGQTGPPGRRPGGGRSGLRPPCGVSAGALPRRGWGKVWPAGTSLQALLGPGVGLSRDCTPAPDLPGPWPWPVGS